jgi:DNA-binding LytR/AlgR family response regulator
VFLAAFTFNSWARDSVVRAQKTEGSRLCGGIVVKTMRGTVLVDFASIVRVEASGNYVTLFTADRQFLHRATMKEVAELLPAVDFARTHRSHIVRLIAIRGIRSGPDGEKIVDLPGGAQVPLSRTYATSRSWIVSLHSSGEANHPSVS